MNVQIKLVQMQQEVGPDIRIEEKLGQLRQDIGIYDKWSGQFKKKVIRKALYT